jgi:tetratricopeptide (TPR) repeat protein
VQRLLAAFVATAAITALVAEPQTAVRVWQASIELPTYAEDTPNPNPPFDVFTFGRFNYPYPIRDALTNRRERVNWRSLNMENEYLRLTVLPDLGGHVYSCLDKRSGRELFYANTAIKKALIGYRGAWAAFGVEFNFPVSHNWVSMSPVDFAVAPHPDGSASIWVGNTDQVYGSHWRVELMLRPGRAVLEQHVELYNRTDVRHRYYWWTNAAVRAWEDSRLVYPTELMATHGFTSVEPWPIDREGRDLSVIRNQTDGPVSLFTYKTREAFVGVYHPHTTSGTVHVADPAEIPVHKVWSWGSDREAAFWRTALSDDDSAYVELQAGLFRNQETYAFLEPQETVRFSEYWLPVRDLGGITRANVDAVLNMERPAPARVRIALDPTRDIPDAQIIVKYGNSTATDTRVSLSPRAVWRTELDNVPAEPITIAVFDSRGGTVLKHTENIFDRTSAAGARLGATAIERPSRSADRSVDEIVERGLVDELEGRRLAAMESYRAALERHPESAALLKAAGRLAVSLGWTDTRSGHSADATGWLESALARNTTDFEAQYYLGLALLASGRSREAQGHLEFAARFRETRIASMLQLARLAAREGHQDRALQLMETIAAEAPRAAAAGAFEVCLLRHLHRETDARARARYWLDVDPTSTRLRYELTLLGDSDPALWLHLGADANRVLDAVDQYLTIAAYDDALALLQRAYPKIEPPMREPGAVAPGESPLVAYYLGYVRAHAGGAARADYERGRSLATTYVFPNRRSSYAVLEDAVRVDPEDAPAAFLLGSLYLSSGLTEQAIEAWQRVRRINPAIPTLHRNLGLALLRRGGDYSDARAVLEEGVAADSANVDVYIALDGVLSATDASPRDRAAMLRRYPASAAMPASLVFKLALALAEGNESSAAERLFYDRFFPGEEGGTNVRTVYVQTRLTSAALAARADRCDEALAILDSFALEQRGLAFTAGGLADALDAPSMSRQTAAIESTCGRTAAARGRWERLERGLTSGRPLAVAIAADARRRLGRSQTADERRVVDAALESADRTLESGDSSNPGLVEYARAQLLAVLGRRDESRSALKRVFVYPDRNLSHALARAALNGGSGQ